MQAHAGGGGGAGAGGGGGGVVLAGCHGMCPCISTISEELVGLVQETDRYFSSGRQG